MNRQAAATAPEDVDPSQYALVSLAMQEPQYSVRSIRDLLAWVAAAKVPCLSIMNMPPLPYLRRLPGIDASSLESAFADARVWDGFEPGLVTLCSPDPQAFRPPEQGTNVLHVGLPTNFKATAFDNPAYTAIERVDRLVQMIGAQLGMQNDEVDATASTIDSALKRNQRQAA